MLIIPADGHTTSIAICAAVPDAEVAEGDQMAATTGCWHPHGGT
jgi:hypothetical protein